MKKRIWIKDLMSGMVVGDDVYTSSDQLIVPRHSVLNDRMITRLKIYGIPAISIFIKENELDLIGKESIFSTRVKTSKEFQEFSKKYSHITDNVEDSMNKIIKKEISATELIDTMTEYMGLTQQNDGQFHVFDMLNNMRETSDITYMHSINVSLIATVLGKWLRFSEEDIEILGLCGLLHDIGKLLIPENILYKPYKLTEKEFEVVKSHSLKGYQVIKDLDIDERVKHVALMHHERCDGSGYPMSLKRDQISKFAKVIAIADVYDAMTSSRLYREPICPFDVIIEFEREGLQLYETEYIMTFLRNVAQTYLHNQVRLSDGTEGEVIMINSFKLAKPVVRAGDSFIDLSKESELRIEAII
ncbi:MAG: HD-GYP domain-containing protein [Clostridiales bacterium]|nr:HD-GYP domain-containing protein [Clostridiales bacterium]